MTTKQLTDVPGIGATAAALLRDAGFHTASDLANASAEALSGVRGFGPARARRTIEAAKSTVNALPEAGSPADAAAEPIDREQTEEKAATAAPPAADQPPTTATKPTASASRPSAQPTPAIQPTATKGSMIGRLVREPWYLIGLAVVVMVGTGLARESGLTETWGLGSGQPEVQAGTTAPTAAAQLASPSEPAEEAASDNGEPAAVAAAPGDTETQPASPETAVPAVYRPFAYPYGSTAEAMSGESEGGAGGSFANPPAAPGYGHPYPYYGYVPFALPYPVLGPYRAGIPGFGRY